MVKIFLSAGHGGFKKGAIDSEAVAGGTTEAKEMELTRDAIETELKNRSFTVLSVPDKMQQVCTKTRRNRLSRFLIAFV